MRLRNPLLYLLLLFVALACYLAVAASFVLFYGKPVPAPNIPRQITLGTAGTPLTYVVIGDSTSIGQGAKYEDSYAYQSAQFLAKDHIVTLKNFGVSGARVADAEQKQLAKAIDAKPDVVLLAIGANDVTHFTSTSKFTLSLDTILQELRSKNCTARIVTTGVPAMGSVPRFVLGLTTIAAHRAQTFNDIYTQLAKEYDVAFAPVAEKTGAAFAKDRSLFASDNFHPSARGYALWTPVINDALTKSAAITPDACPK